MHTIMNEDWSETSGKYTLKKIGPVYSCDCPSWRFQYAPISQRTCKHLVARLGYDHEMQRAPRSVLNETRKKPEDRETNVLTCGPMAYRTWSAEDKIQPSREWLWSKKLNGIFVRWQDNKLWTKKGRRLLCPSVVTEKLPLGVTLDAELYAGKDDQSRQIVRLANSGDWSQGTPVVYVFDIVDMDLPFKSRYKKLKGLQKENGFELVKHHRFNLFKVQDMVDECLRLGEEGVVLRDPDGMYSCSKSIRQANIIKAKPVEIGTGIVIGITNKATGVTLRVKEGEHIFNLFVHHKQPLSFALNDTVHFKFSGRHSNGTPDHVQLFLE